MLGEFVARALWPMKADWMILLGPGHSRPSSLAAAKYASSGLPPPFASQLARIQPAGTLGGLCTCARWSSASLASCLIASIRSAKVGTASFFFGAVEDFMLHSYEK